jgi:PTS system nitrogen regulatory IIA component
MSSNDLDLIELAAYLQRDARDIEKLAQRGRLPGRKVAGAWRFNRDEVNQWLDRQFSEFTDAQLEGVEVGLEGGPKAGGAHLIVRPLMTPQTCAAPLNARTAAGVVQALVNVANSGWQVYSPAIVLEAVRARENLHSTALPGGVAIPHPRRPLTDALADSLIAYGRTLTGIPFGGPRGQLTDLYFLILCRDERSHLQALARLSRMFQREGFLESLRHADSIDASLQLIETAEEEVIG